MDNRFRYFLNVYGDDPWQFGHKWLEGLDFGSSPIIYQFDNRAHAEAAPKPLYRVIVRLKPGYIDPRRQAEVDRIFARRFGEPHRG